MAKFLERLTRSTTHYHDVTRAMANDPKLVQKAAANIIDRYGDNALTEIDQRIDELEARGERNAAELWAQIRKAVEFLTLGTSSKTKH